MLHPWKDAAILKCSHLIFSKAAMFLIASLLSITITGCVLSEGTCRTTLNPLQPDLDKGQPRLARSFWSHCLRARELWLSVPLPTEYCNLFQRQNDQIDSKPLTMYFCVYEQYGYTTFSLGRFARLIKMIFDFFYIVPRSYINLVLSAVTARTDKASSMYALHTITKTHSLFR